MFICMDDERGERGEEGVVYIIMPAKGVCLKAHTHIHVETCSLHLHLFTTAASLSRHQGQGMMLRRSCFMIDKIEGIYMMMEWWVVVAMVYLLVCVTRRLPCMYMCVYGVCMSVNIEEQA